MSGSKVFEQWDECLVGCGFWAENVQPMNILFVVFISFQEEIAGLDIRDKLLAAFHNPEQRISITEVKPL